MKLRRRKDPMEIMGQTVVADVIHDDEEKPSLCVLRGRDGVHHASAIYDDLKLDAEQLRWIADRLDEANGNPTA